MQRDFMVYRPSLSEKVSLIGSSALFQMKKEQAEKLSNVDSVLLCGSFSDFHFTHGQKRKVKQVGSFLFQERKDFLLLLQYSHKANYCYLEEKIGSFSRLKSLFSCTDC